MNRTLILNTRPFDFRRLVFSHGWVFLAPFEWSDDRQILSRPLRLRSGGSVRVNIKASANGGSAKVRITCESTDAMSADDRQAIREQVRRMFRLDEDYSEFHQLCAEDP